MFQTQIPHYYSFCDNVLHKMLAPGINHEATFLKTAVWSTSVSFRDVTARVGRCSYISSAGSLQPKAQVLNCIKSDKLIHLFPSQRAQ
jgi:hypothetical protein